MILYLVSFLAGIVIIFPKFKMELKKEFCIGLVAIPDGLHTYLEVYRCHTLVKYMRVSF